MYLFQLLRDHWLALGAITISLWFFTASLLPEPGQRNDPNTCEARAKRAREYQRLRRLWIDE